MGRRPTHTSIRSLALLLSSLLRHFFLFFFLNVLLFGAHLHHDLVGLRCVLALQPDWLAVFVKDEGERRASQRQEGWN
jgi:hypothetical protein